MTDPERVNQVPPKPLPLGRLGRGLMRRFTFFALLSLAIMTFASLYAAWRQVEAVRLFQEQVSSQAAQALDAWVVDLESTLRPFAQDPYILDAPPEEMEKHLREVLMRSPTVRSVALVDARPGKEGHERLRLKAGSDTPASGADRSTEEWFRAALEEGTYISPVGYNKITTLAQAIESEERVVGVVALEADLSWAYELLRQFRTTSGGYIYVVDAAGRSLLHEHAPFMYAHPDELASVAGIQAAIRREPLPPIYVGLNQDQERVIGAATPLRKLPALVLAEQPLPWIVQRLFPLGYAALAILLIGAAAALIVGRYILRNLARPIARLQAGVQQVAAGDLTHRIALEGRGELADLAGEFNRMAQALQEAQSRQEAWSHELEERVAERTHELQQALEEQQVLLRTVRMLSNPVIPLLEGALLCPVMGAMDGERAQRLMADILGAVEQHKARLMILDITALAVMDTAVAQVLLQTAQAAHLLGTDTILVGISPGVAETLVHLGVEFRDLSLAATLQEGLEMALRLLGQRARPGRPR